MKKYVFVLILAFCLSSTLVACSPQSQTEKFQKPAYHDENAPPTKEEIANAKG